MDRGACPQIYIQIARDSHAPTQSLLEAVALVGFGLLSWSDALAGVRRGLDVYLFLTGMMLLAELARAEGLFDWLAAVAVELARGSPHRLFALVYAVGTVVTVLLSNDATAVVLSSGASGFAISGSRLRLLLLQRLDYVEIATEFPAGFWAYSPETH